MIFAHHLFSCPTGGCQTCIGWVKGIFIIFRFWDTYLVFLIVAATTAAAAAAGWVRRRVPAAPAAGLGSWWLGRLRWIWLWSMGRTVGRTAVGFRRSNNLESAGIWQLQSGLWVSHQHTVTCMSLYFSASSNEILQASYGLWNSVDLEEPVSLTF